MDSIITQIEALAAQADEAGRIKLLLSLRDLQLRVETSKDTFMRFYNAVCFVLCLLKSTLYPNSWIHDS